MKKIIKCKIFDLTGYNECGGCSEYSRCEIFERGSKCFAERKTKLFYATILDGDDKITD